ncbi:MAG: nuclear transport factor 2 family protein [Arenicellaceae bacterium]|nr:nuclear transport factor 2 family protein [Arenicellaceae bacterium]
MKQPQFLYLQSILASCLLTLISIESYAQMEGQDAQTVLTSNATFEQAMEERNRGVIDRLLDPDFSWIFPEGSYYGRPETIAALPQTAPGKTGETISIAERAYGNVRALEVSSGLVRALRIWVLRAEGWRLLHINELVKRAEPEGDPGPYRVAYRDTLPVPVCDNPCETVPYLPTSQRSKDALLSWQQQEIGAHTMDMDLWGAYVTDDWVGLRAGAQRNPKARRIALTNRRKENGVFGSAQSTVLQMRLYDLEDAVLMVSLTQGLRGRPEYRTRIFVHDGTRADGGPLYKMAESYGQAVFGAPVFEREQE